MGGQSIWVEANFAFIFEIRSLLSGRINPVKIDQAAPYWVM